MVDEVDGTYGGMAAIIRGRKEEMSILVSFEFLDVLNFAFDDVLEFRWNLDKAGEVVV